MHSIVLDGPRVDYNAIVVKYIPFARWREDENASPTPRIGTGASKLVYDLGEYVLKVDIGYGGQTKREIDLYKKYKDTKYGRSLAKILAYGKFQDSRGTDRYWEVQEKATLYCDTSGRGWDQFCKSLKAINVIDVTDHPGNYGVNSTGNFVAIDYGLYHDK